MGSIGIREGSVVVDVACGKGATLLPAAEEAGSSGCVVGVDISPEMVRHARARASERGPENVRVAVMDGESLAARDGAADAVICAFSMHFFPDPQRAVQEFARIVVPGGTVAISEWAATDERWTWEDELIGELPAKGVSSGAFDTAPALEEVLAAAGFVDLSVEMESLDVHLADEEEWWAWKWSYSFRHILEALNADTRDRFKAEAFDHLAAMRTDNGIPLTLHALMALARK